ncbi:L,D-transpeptidase [Bradyrhizobium sp. SZCCHNR1015]|uniref:L,D-transpeptidase n=1 Tax=Bradyrhizobium sp. SZCCHNR1015 TaxID=3057338 RepID=UPI00291653DD|nr:L,D-transpeptidase family protein [Bradyrhizobium sp. SZCCHNR1015]
MRTILFAVAGFAFLSATPALAKIDITVDKNNQIMTVAVDGVERYRWPVSTGIPSRETPNGSFRAFRMEADHFSKEFDDAPMPHSIFFTKVGHAIHGTDSESRLGTPASHGCVRLSKANATTLYDLVQKDGVLNTTVTLTGSAEVALARHPRRGTAVARREAPQQSDDSGEPVMLTPQPQLLPARPVAPQQRADDGYIYPADGSDNGVRYPAPRGTERRVYDAQAYPQQQQYYYDSGNPSYAQPRYYQPRPYYQSRGYYTYQD